MSSFDDDLKFFSERIAAALGVDKSLLLNEKCGDPNFEADQRALYNSLRKRIDEHLISSGINPEEVDLFIENFKLTYDSDAVVVEDVPVEFDHLKLKS